MTPEKDKKPLEDGELDKVTGGLTAPVVIPLDIADWAEPEKFQPFYQHDEDGKITPVEMAGAQEH